MASIRGQRNNLLAGVFVIASIVLAVYMIIKLGGGFEGWGRQAYVVNFDVEEGVEGLSAGGAVTVGGLESGAINAVDFVLDDSGVISRLRVEIEVDPEIEFREGAIAFLKRPLLGGSGTLNFSSLGDGPVIQPGGEIDGAISAPSFLAEAGYGDDQKAQLQNILARFSELGDKSGGLADDARLLISDARGAVSDVREGGLRDFNEMVADARAQWDADWSDRVGRILENAETFTVRANEIGESFDNRVLQARDLVASLQETVNENRAQFDNVVDNADEFMDNVNGKWSDLLDEGLTRGRDAIKNAEDTVARVRATVTTETPGVRRAIASFRLTADNLRDTTSEIRRSPWRLLYRPNNRELEYELLYDSARSFAQSVSDLTAATASLQAIADTDGAQLKPEDVAEAIETLTRSLQKHADAEQRFLEQLLDQGE
ncbi:MAG: hypothetical protein AAGD00_00160 [Planctomycetota bacterium]